MENENERTLGFDGIESPDETETEPEGTEGGEAEAEAEAGAEAEAPEALKERAERAERERDRYRNDLLALKKSKREERRSAKAEPDIESRVQSVIFRNNERAVLRKVVDEKSPLYIPELVDDRQYRDIVGFLPRNADRSSEEGIHRALKAAVRTWKEERGEKEETKEGKDVAAEVAANSAKPGAGGSQAPSKASSGLKLLRKEQPMSSWYPKKTQ